METKIRKIRKEKGLVMAQLSGLAGIQLSRLCILEKGYIRPNVNEIRKLSKALEVNENELIDERNN